MLVTLHRCNHGLHCHCSWIVDCWWCVAINCKLMWRYRNNISKLKVIYQNSEVPVMKKLLWFILWIFVSFVTTS